MTCGHCIRSITAAVKAVDPSADLHIDLATHRVDIESRVATGAVLGDAIEEAGYTPVAVITGAGEAIAGAAPARSGCCCGGSSRR